MKNRLSPWYEAREALRGALERDLLGSDQDELLNEAPLNRMIAGILHPQGGAPVEETQKGDGVDPANRAEDGTVDAGVTLSHVRAPSSMGMTFAIDTSTESTVGISFSATRYERVSDGAPEIVVDDVITRGGTAGDEGTWRAIPVNAVASLALDGAQREQPRIKVADGLEGRFVVRRDDSPLVRVTVVLLNTHVHESGPKDHICFFRPKIVAELTSGVFIDRRPVNDLQIDDDDHTTNDLLYQSVKNLAVGHGCAVSWGSGESVRRLNTTFLPDHELALAEPAGGSSILAMREFALGEGFDKLRLMLSEYRRWIDEMQLGADEMDDSYRETTDRHIKQARQAAGRIELGITLVEEDEFARRAFMLMNRAMNDQRIRQEKIRAGNPDLNAKAQIWRPFQMAFILINLPGLSDPKHADREVVDLLWFPTGGGKTEAYLGAMAFSILLRRLKDPTDGGVSVLMRYTLRLLTLQQFERAATLVCALELLRRTELPHAVAISLGLWVGQDATPNRVKKADEVLKKLRKGEPVEKSNPRQLLRCPWCGANMGFDSYVISRAKDRLTIRCSNATCDFGDALPVHLTDEDVYRERPSIVIGTVDKFAMMAWNSDVSALLSTDNRNSRPDLIVQDELHLISGPLGTMVGLYESVVDLACTGVGRPKVIASTATIRRAQRQVRAIFDRDAAQFPPPGLDARDTFFSTEASPEEKGTRQYVGVFAPGVSQSTLVVRTYAALLDAAWEIDVDDSVRDAYWTLLGYFNSLRVLGGAYLQVVDDVPDRLRVVARRRGGDLRKLTEEPTELTSRKPSSAIPAAMRALETSYPNSETPDVVLATNMISVGLDVERLGLMVVAGQPQSTAEYIQATSRVGRRFPGLVVVLYNSARSRDQSHYENFTTYHRALYREVEATTATPFAPRARDRGAHGILVSMTRLLIPELRPDRSASEIESHTQKLGELREMVVARCRSVAPDQAVAFDIQLRTLINEWRDSADADVSPTEAYPGWRERIGMLLMPAGGGEDESEAMSFPVSKPPWPTLTSMRDVDATTSLALKRRRIRHGR